MLYVNFICCVIVVADCYGIERGKGLAVSLVNAFGIERGKGLAVSLMNAFGQ